MKSIYGIVILGEDKERRILPKFLIYKNTDVYAAKPSTQGLVVELEQQPGQQRTCQHDGKRQGPLVCYLVTVDECAVEAKTSEQYVHERIVDGIERIGYVAQFATETYATFAGRALGCSQPHDGGEQEGGTHEVVQPIGPLKRNGGSKACRENQYTTPEEGMAHRNRTKASGHEHAHTIGEEHSDQSVPPAAVGCRPPQSDVALGKAEI